MERETWRNGPSDRRHIVFSILPSRGPLRQPTPYGLFWHIFSISRRHSRGGAAYIDIDCAVTRRAGSSHAEQLSAVTRTSAFLCVGRNRSLRRKRTTSRCCLTFNSFAA